MEERTYGEGFGSGFSRFQDRSGSGGEVDPWIPAAWPISRRDAAGLIAATSTIAAATGVRQLGFSSWFSTCTQRDHLQPYAALLSPHRHLLPSCLTHPTLTHHQPAMYHLPHTCTDFCDVTVTTSSGDWRLHSLLLASRSEFFYRALAGEFTESRSKVIELHLEKSEAVS